MAKTNGSTRRDRGNPSKVASPVATLDDIRELRSESIRLEGVLGLYRDYGVAFPPKGYKLVTRTQMREIIRKRQAPTPARRPR